RLQILAGTPDHQPAHDGVRRGYSHDAALAGAGDRSAGLTFEGQLAGDLHRPGMSPLQSYHVAIRRFVEHTLQISLSGRNDDPLRPQRRGEAGGRYRRRPEIRYDTMTWH